LLNKSFIIADENEMKDLWQRNQLYTSKISAPNGAMRKLLSDFTGEN
jgi:hypothetical protein